MVSDVLLTLCLVVFASREVDPDVTVGSFVLEPWEEVAPPLASSQVFQSGDGPAFLSRLSKEPAFLGIPS